MAEEFSINLLKVQECNIRESVSKPPISESPSIHYNMALRFKKYLFFLKEK